MLKDCMAMMAGFFVLFGAAVPAAGQQAETARTSETSRGSDSDSAIRSGIAAWERGDDEAAVRHWEPHAAAGDPDALFNMGQAYRLGRGVPPDMALAAELYRRAAAQGHMDAASNYAILLHAGGRQADAMPLLQEAAERRDARARYLVGLAHFNGDWLPRDWPRAYALVSLAARAGLDPARNALARIEARLDPAQREEGLALAQILDSGTGGVSSGSGPAVKAVPAPALIEPAPPAPASTDEPAPDAGSAWLQLGTFGVGANASRLRDRLADEPGLDGHSIVLRQAGRFTLVTAQGFADLAEARAACSALRARGFECLAKR